MLSWATVAGHRTGDNPARWKGNLSELLPKPGRVARSGNHPALALSDAPQWLAEVAQRPGAASLALRFAALTGARSGEVRGALWSEIDLEARIWTVPAERMKAGRDHRVPLTAPAVAILDAACGLPAGREQFVFPAPGGGALSDMALSATMRRVHAAAIAAGRRGYLDARSGRPAVPHGLRSTFRDWAAEHGYERDMAEIALAHTVGSEVERAYALTGSTDAQSIFFLCGHGSNGKSVLREVLRRVVGGDYGRTASSEVFLRSVGTQHPAGLADLAGARLALVSELPQGRVWNDELLKDISGGEAISARHMHGNPFSFTPQATVIVTGNHRPSFTSADEAMARRMVLVELRRRFGPQEIDPGLAGKLLAEGPAVLRWMIEGAAAWIAAGGGREGLAIPPDVLAAGRQYAEEEDILRQFLTDRQLANPGSWAAGGFIASDALYREFRRWAEDNGHRQWTKTTFGKQLTAGAERYGLAPKRTRAQRGYEIERLLIDDEERASALDRIAGGVGRLTVVGGRDGGHASRE